MYGISPSVACIAAIIAVVNAQFVPDKPNDRVQKDKMRHLLHDDLEKLLNSQVSLELEASLAYMAMSSYFADENQNRLGFAKYFKQASQEEWEHAQKFVEYLGKRGTRLKSLVVKMPENFTWPNGAAAFRGALELERTVTNALSTIHNLAADKKDAHLTDYLESEFLTEQVDSMRELSGHMNNLNAMIHGGNDVRHQKHDALAEYLFDVQLQKKDDD